MWPRCDVWALGCLVWALAFGYSPYESSISHDGTITLVESSHLRSLSSPNPPPVDDLKTTRHEPMFYRRVERLARRLFLADAEHRPDIHGAIALILDLDRSLETHERRDDAEANA